MTICASTDGPWETSDGDRVEVAGEILEPADGQTVPCITISLNWWRAEGLTHHLDRLSAVCETIGHDEVSERELSRALRAAVESIKTQRTSS
jgi:hypothetical protein